MGRIALSLFVAALAAGCRSGPTQACVDIVEAYAHDDARCGLTDYASARTADEAVFTHDHGCGAASMVRDKASLYATCIPWIEGLTCEQLTDPSTVEDPSCTDQITVVYYSP